MFYAIGWVFKTQSAYMPQSAVQVNSVNWFKNQLEKKRINQMDFFMND